MSGYEWGAAKYRDGDQVVWVRGTDYPWTEVDARYHLQNQRRYEADADWALVRRPLGEWERVDD